MKIALCAAAIGVAMLTGYGLSAPPAQAGYVVTLTQQGSNVVATGSGPIDLSGLTFSSGSFTFAEMIPSIADITTGPTLVFTATDTYTGFSMDQAVLAKTRRGPAQAIRERDEAIWLRFDLAWHLDAWCIGREAVPIAGGAGI